MRKMEATEERETERVTETTKIGVGSFETTATLLDVRANSRRGLAAVSCVAILC
jgi:hypothetical protein